MFKQGNRWSHDKKEWFPFEKNLRAKCGIVFVLTLENVSL